MNARAARARRRAASASRYPTDPPSAASTGRPVLEHSVFDRRRYLWALEMGLIDGIPELDHPNDGLLVATVVELGCPRWAAEQMRHNPALRLAFYGLWEHVQAAARGNRDAQELVDVARASWDASRRIELISDIPDHTIGLWQR